MSVLDEFYVLFRTSLTSTDYTIKETRERARFSSGCTSFFCALHSKLSATSGATGGWIEARKLCRYKWILCYGRFSSVYILMRLPCLFLGGFTVRQRERDATPMWRNPHTPCVNGPAIEPPPQSKCQTCRLIAFSLSLSVSLPPQKL